MTWRPSRPSGEPEAATHAHERLESFVAGLPFGGAAANPVLESAAAELFAAFEAAEIDALLLKGPALAKLLYEPGERRGYTDIDLLPGPDHLVRAAGVLSGLGYRNASAQIGIEDVGRAVPADTWLSPPGVPAHELDFHRWLPGAQAAPEAAWQALWSRRTTIELAGRPVPVLSREGQALHLALHAAQHGPDYVKGVFELRLALERWPLEVWEEASALASGVEAVPLFAAGLRLVPAGGALAERLRLPDEGAVDWEVGHRADRPRGTFHVDALGRAPGLSGRMRLLRRALLPNRRWLEVEYHWAQRGPLRLALAYVLHLARTPVWGARAWAFRRRARRAGRGRD